jgi:aspartate oxidase
MSLYGAPWLQRVAISGKSDRRQGRRNRRNPPMEVAPTAHYPMGGVRAHACDGRRGLFAVGECAAGVHGANRLGGNSLAECLVFGRIVGAEAARASAELDVQVRDRTRSTRRGRRSTPCSPSAATSSRDRSSALDEIRERTSALEVRPDIAGYADSRTPSTCTRRCSRHERHSSARSAAVTTTVSQVWIAATTRAAVSGWCGGSGPPAMRYEWSR